MQQCGFCSMISGFLRRAMCLGSRRGSSGDSYYRELGDQDTLKIEDKMSELSENSIEITSENQRTLQSTKMDESIDLDNQSKRATNSRFLTMHKRRKKQLLTRSLCRDVALLDDLLPSQIQCILDQTVHWKFNAFTLENVSGGRCLPVLCIHLFHTYGLLSHFNLDVIKLWKLFSLIEDGYHSSNPYHNSVHAADVTQAMHCFLQQTQILSFLEPVEIMASLIGAIAHDVDHPGVNQPFLIATSNHLAALYQNTSVLENHHWRSAISCLIESGVCAELKDVRTQLERQITSLILATDITRQQEFLNKFKGYLDTGTLDMRLPEHRHLVLQIALKCADISNPCRPWDISRKWSLRVCEEFFRQGDYERKLNLPVTALCDRHTTSIPKIQTSFFAYVVAPLVAEWHRFLQNDLSEQMLKNLRYNQGKWEMLAAQELADETRTEISDTDIFDEELDFESVTNVSESAELLLPERRQSLSASRQMSFGDHLRRFSVPLNIFHDNTLRNRDQNNKPTFESGSMARDASLEDSERSLHSQLSLHGHRVQNKDTILSSDSLLPDLSIASITTPIQATRLKSALKNTGANWKLFRQQTFPPLETAIKSAQAMSKLPYYSNDPMMFPKPEDVATVVDNRLRSLIENQKEIDKTDKSAYEILLPKVWQTEVTIKENFNPYVMGFAKSERRESAPVGSQLKDNLSAVQLSSLTGEQVPRRRKSMPTDTLTYVSKEKRVKECAIEWMSETNSRRRGSAPLVPSELRTISALFKHSMSGNQRKKPPSLGSCQQWVSKTSYNIVQEHHIHLFPRRSSLPVEVIGGAKKL